MKTIYICTTMRDFKNNDNDEIQRYFLRSLEESSLPGLRIKLVVTTYGEKRVQEEVRKVLNKVDVLFVDGEITDCRFSLSEVFKNGMVCSLGDESSLGLIWTTCDVIFSNKFFLFFESVQPTSLSVTSHPHPKAISLDAFHEGRFTEFGPADGIDFLYFSNDVLNEKNFAEDISFYTFKDWGVFEHFLCALANKYCSKRINLYFVAKVLKIVNDRVPNQETLDYFKKCLMFNWPVFDAYVSANQNLKKFKHLIFCHFSFNHIDQSGLLIKFLCLHPISTLRGFFNALMIDMKHFFIGRSK